MIIDKLQNTAKLCLLNPRFKRSFEFLKQEGLEKLPDGKYEIDGDAIYAMISTGKGRTRTEAPLEAHRKYIDIQYVISGTEEMGWRSLGDCSTISDKYDEKKDIIFFKNMSETWITLLPGMFVVFFPDDAHAPLISDGTIRKVVVKVRI